ncbi:transcriptional regulator [Carnobacterium divergens]|uniref:Transcriptional regulator n=1 Tax=Carnobacterium divergens TaxID=2748 RepID=A0A5F0MHI5_CARDV|nr:helix-turn-helix transcriptional regulator [Carnobacterium divergens]MPQ22206.1 XRE family transcriptional regulator [Carnobacterium divergens]TFI69088.1 transcriptional regulator [Carnobacterium divergens]TFI69213.1 transcriptional regulator [Carnobacterium divergens]TFI75510.1 transcriptional regulator [Carnobacterium divergens]TFI76576.1 transcriptional regulator [Carnobacterium divergens]
MTTFDRVKKLADKQKITIVELEEKVGFSRNSLYSWKKNNPSSEKLEKVADFFGVSTDYLLGREKPQIVEDDKLKVIASHIDDDVTEDDMEEILNFIEFIKSKNK